MYQTQMTNRSHACRYPGCGTYTELCDRVANYAICAASAIGVIAAMFFLLTL